MKKQKEKQIIIALHVDDFYIFANCKIEVQKLKKESSKKFEMKDLGEIKECLGIRVRRDCKKGIITLDQENYTEGILKRFGMNECKPVSTPLIPNEKLAKHTEKDKYPFQELIGALMYLSVCTRPDISYAISSLSHFNTCYGREHWITAKKVLSYLKGTKNYCLKFQKSKEIIVNYADADWGGCIVDSHSYSGCIMTFAGAAISWQSRKQKCVALSATEAEYVGLCEASKEAVYVKGLYNELHCGYENVVVYNDNQGAGKLAENPIFHGRTKHSH